MLRSPFKLLFLTAALCLFATADASFAARPKVGFCDVARRADRTAVDFKLGRVEAYNRLAARERRPAIRYQAYQLGDPACGLGLDFVFFGLSKDQFRDVRKLYGDVGRAKPRRGRADYRLLDFMSPVMQALDGHVFRYTNTEVPQINAGRTGAYGTPNAPVDRCVGTSTNCWSTLYAVLRDLGDHSKKRERGYTLFYADRFQADAVLGRISDPVAKVKVRGQAPVALPAGSMAFGDLLLVKKNRRQLRDIELSARGTIISSTPGKMVKLLEHAGLVVDENLIFEKPDGGADLPFRLVSLESAVAPYRSRSQVEIQIRRANGAPVQPARQVFGGAANAVEERYSRPLPERLRSSLILNKELEFPHEGQYFNSWAQILDLGLRLSSRTRRYTLEPRAFRPDTYTEQLVGPSN